MPTPASGAFASVVQVEAETIGIDEQQTSDPGAGLRPLSSVLAVVGACAHGALTGRRRASALSGGARTTVIAGRRGRAVACGSYSSLSPATGVVLGAVVVPRRASARRFARLRQRALRVSVSSVGRP